MDDLCTCGGPNGCMIHKAKQSREEQLEALLKRVVEENDHNVSTEGLISTLTWDLREDIVKALRE